MSYLRLFLISVLLCACAKEETRPTQTFPIEIAKTNIEYSSPILARSSNIFPRKVERWYVDRYPECVAFLTDVEKGDLSKLDTNKELLKCNRWSFPDGMALHVAVAANQLKVVKTLVLRPFNSCRFCI